MRKEKYTYEDFNNMKNSDKFKSVINELTKVLYIKFGKEIEAKFNNDINAYRTWKRGFGILASKAKNFELSKEEAREFSFKRKMFNSTFGISAEIIRKRNKPFRWFGTLIRYPSGLIDAELSLHFKVIKSGKDFKTSYHWSKKYLPKGKEEEEKAVKYY